MLVSKPSEGSMQSSKKSHSNRLQIKEIGRFIKNVFLTYNTFLIKVLFSIISFKFYKKRIFSVFITHIHTVKNVFHNNLYR